MAIGSVAHHDSIASTSNLSTYGGATSAPTANRLIIACIQANGGTAGNTTISSLSGYGLTWTAVHGPVNIDTTGAATADVWLYAADTGGSPSSTAFSVTFAAARTGALVSIFTADGADFSGGISSAFVQFVDRNMADGGTATGGTITLASAGHADNRSFGWFNHEANEASTVGTSFTAIRGATAGELNHNNPNSGCLSEWRSDTFDTSVDASWAGTNLWGGFAFELKAVTGGGPSTRVLTILSGV